MEHSRQFLAQVWKGRNDNNTITLQNMDNLKGLVLKKIECGVTRLLFNKCNYPKYFT